jgi:hypothetical protein
MTSEKSQVENSKENAENEDRKSSSRQFPKPPTFTYPFEPIEKTWAERKSNFPKPPKVQLILLKNITIDDEPRESQIVETDNDELYSL